MEKSRRARNIRRILHNDSPNYHNTKKTNISRIMTHATEITLVFIPFLFLMLSRLYFQREKSIRGRVYDIQKPVDLILNVLAISWLANEVSCFFPQGTDFGFAYWILAFAISMVVTVVFVGIVGGMSRRLWPDAPTQNYVRIRISRGMKTVAYALTSVVMAAFAVTFAALIINDDMRDSGDTVIAIALIALFAASAIYNLRSLIRLYR